MIWMVFAAAWCIQLIFCLLAASGIRRSNPPEGSGWENKPISVIVSLRNEEENLPALVQHLQAQDYPNFEVILVDDGSDDASSEIIDQVASQDPRFSAISNPSGNQGKKQALTLAIESAAGPLLAFTDADCQPPPQWLSAIARGHSNESTVLVGYSPIRPTDGSPLNRFERYETLFTAVLTASAIGLGRPYMAVGRNISYTKDLFRAVGGHSHSMQSLSGDDDLLVQQVQRLGIGSVRYLADPAGAVPTQGAASISHWVRQKLRHTSASRHYSKFAQVWLGGFHLTNLLAFLAPIFLGWWGVLGLYILLLLRWATTTRMVRAVDPDPHWVSFLVQPILYVIYNTVLPPLGILRKRAKW